MTGVGLIDRKLERVQVRALRVMNRAADFAPATQACCGVCRTCATTNVLTLGGAAGVWVLTRLRHAGLGRL
jgi:hypothetical protein